MTTSRDELLTHFVEHSGWGHCAREFLAGDASNRKYERLIDIDGGHSAILMDAPPEKGEDVRPFVHVATHLVHQGFSAPKILHEDAENGFLLIEDLGDALFARVCEGNPNAELELYEAAIDVLVQSHTDAAPDWLHPYDAATYLREAMLFVDWYLPNATGQAVDPLVVDAFGAAVADACTGLNTASPVLVQRDYHAENLLWLPERDGLQRVGLLDFQDALAGHRAYDLVSLLEDARRDTSDDLRTALFDRYVTQSDLDAATFQRNYQTLGAQRNLKILGIFARLCVRDGKWSYVDLMPRVWDHLMRDLEHPVLASLKAWVTEHAPAPSLTVRDQIKAQAGA